ncbi:hypothetical protein MIND_01353400 [Mycena indigotica]|uniref:F-box domain-containing protein n=1 Tax=Mycena indigotica TaxID=2126181 RepID=A0A8H6RZN7_9AGAR|nr:uncharacterized protein MIND_01353400 [Mycena indigotica]KAF7289792.1 hypothetical protein MIND_01353400 [Mycena indigotica]
MAHFHGQPEVPDEILLQIFHCALPPSWTKQYAHQQPPFPRARCSVDRRTKISLASVCRSWYRVAAELLYEHISLSTIGQLVALVETLQTRADLAKLVKSASMCYVMPSGYAIVHEQALHTLFDLCPNLVDWELNSTPVIGADICGPPFQLSAFQLTSLHIFRLNHPAMFHVLRQVCQTLVDATLPLPPDAVFSQLRVPRMLFLKLVNLRLVLSYDSHFPNTWAFPALTALRLVPAQNVLIFLRNTIEATLLGLFSACGKTILSLSVAESVATPRMMHQMLALCPRIQQINAGDFVFNDVFHAEEIQPVYTTVTSLDIVHHHNAELVNLGEVLDVGELRRMLPALKSFRLVPFIAAEFLVWPPPDSDDAEVGDNAELRQLPTIIDPPKDSRLAEMLRMTIDTEDKEDLDDGDFEPSDSESDSSDGEEWESDGEDDGGLCETEVTREDVLAIFRARGALIASSSDSDSGEESEKEDEIR